MKSAAVKVMLNNNRYKNTMITLVMVVSYLHMNTLEITSTNALKKLLSLPLYRNTLIL